MWTNESAEAMVTLLRIVARDLALASGDGRIKLFVET